MGKINVKCYIPFVVSEIKSAMSYRVAFFVSILSRGFTVAVTYFLWRAIYQSSLTPVLAGFSFAEMTNYVIISFFTHTIVSSVPTMLIAREVADGSIAMNLLKPISYRRRILAISLGGLVVAGVITIMPFMLLFTIKGWLTWPGIQTFTIYFISAMLGYLNFFFYAFCFSMLAFYTTYFFGLNMASNVLIKFFSGTLIPLSFFPDALAKIFQVLPFASMNYTPVMIYLGKLSDREILENLALQSLWVIIFFLLGSLLWQHAVKRLTILGG